MRSAASIRLPARLQEPGCESLLRVKVPHERKRFNRLGVRGKPRICVLECLRDFPSVFQVVPFSQVSEDTALRGNRLMYPDQVYHLE